MGCGKRNSLNHRGHRGPQGKNHRENLDALASPALLFFWLFLFLDCHVLQFTGLEHVSTFLTFHIFGFFVAGDYLYPRMLARFGADFF
jgi:hypothetical protein